MWKEGKENVSVWYFLQMNLGNVFHLQEADFTGIAKYARFFVDRVVQKAFIEIDEQGAETAAAIGKNF